MIRYSRHAIITILVLTSLLSAVEREQKEEDSDDNRVLQCRSIELCQEAILRMQKVNIYPRSPSAVLTHSLLFLNTQEEGQFKYSYILDGTFDEGESTFNLRRGKPWPARSQKTYMHEEVQDQYLYLFSLARVPLNRGLSINGEKYCVQDLLSNYLAECTIYSELYYTLPTYLYYLKPGCKWKNKYGTKMDMGIIAALTIDREIGRR